jgi:spore germination protein KC
LSFNIYLSQAHIAVDARDAEHPVFTIKITQQAGLKESPNPLELTNPNVLNDLTELLEKNIRDQVWKAIAESRALKSDYIGFGEVVERENPRGWKKVKDHWEKIFATCEIKVEEDVVIRHTDMRSDSFQINKK